jgi:hypothetical protein
MATSLSALRVGRALAVERLSGTDQPYPSAALYPLKDILVQISVKLMWLEGLGKLIISLGLDPTAFRLVV